MPPWGTCQASWLMRRAHSTWPTSLVRMMPTLGRKPSESITAHHLENACFGIVPQSPRAQQTRAAGHGQGRRKRLFWRPFRPFRTRYYDVRLALFDLDNTLLAGDSDHSWGEFLCNTGRVDAVEYRARNDAFYADYCAGRLDVVAYQSFTQAILSRTEAAELARWQAEFMAEVIEPIILARGEALLAQHRQAGDKLVIITATNRFITGPIAARLGVETLIATECG